MQKAITIFAIVSFSLASVSGKVGAFAQAPENILTECYAGDETIFASEIADIAEFDAAAYNVTLQQSQSYPEHNATIYHFGPTDIMCVVVDE